MIQNPYLVSADPVLDSIQSGQFTIAGWFEVNNYFIPFQPFQFWAGPAWDVHLTSGGLLTFEIFGASGTSVSSAPVNEGWNFVAVTYDPVASGVAIWLNGVVASTALLSNAATPATPIVPGFQLGVSGTSLAPRSPFSLDQTGVWGRVLTSTEIAELYNGGLGDTYPFVGGPFSLIFQAEIINEFDEKPLVLASQSKVFSVSESVTISSGQTVYQAVLETLFQGFTATPGYNWTADNFNDKVLLAQHDNTPLYWTPPAEEAFVLPGLPAGINYDGLCIFQNHVLLWQADNLTWSDVNDFTTYIPVAATAVSATLQLGASFIQPVAGGNVTVNATSPLGAVASISLSGNLAFSSSQAVGTTTQAILTISNTGTTPLTITGIVMPAGVPVGVFSVISALPSVISPGLSAPVIIAFTPAQGISYDGIVTVNSSATTGTSILPISGGGAGSTIDIQLSGILAFPEVPHYNPAHTVTSDLVIQNFGNTAVQATGLSFIGLTSGVFTTTTNFGTSGLTVPAASATGVPGTLLVPIVFTAGAVASYSGQIKVLFSQSPTSGSIYINVSGSGIASAIVPIVFITDNGTIAQNFDGFVVGNTPPTATITVWNTANYAVSISSVTAPNPPFSASFTGAIPAFGKVTFPVTFTPSQAGSFSGQLAITFSTPGHPNGPLIYNDTQSVGQANIATYGVTGTALGSGPAIVLGGDLQFGSVNFGSTLESFLTIQNVGTSIANYTAISVPSGFSVTGSSSGSVAVGSTAFIPITFSPTGSSSPIPYGGLLTVTFASGVTGTDTIQVNGEGIPLPAVATLVADQIVSLVDTSQPEQTYYNFYTVVSDTTGPSGLSLTLMNLTGATPQGRVVGASGQVLNTLDANEAGAAVVAGAKMNGPIFKIIPQGDYAYIFKERSIQSIQYTGLGNGIFFIHNEVSGEGLIGRNAAVDCNDGRMVFLGHKELYLYTGGPNPQAICQQYTRQLYRELDYSRLYAVRLFHNENRKEIWTAYPIKGGGFKVLIWNYVEDSASIDLYDNTQVFSALGFADWSNNVTWAQLTGTWQDFGSTTWSDLNSGDVDHLPLIAFEDGSIVAHGKVYSRDGAGYISLSESMDYDFQNPDIFKYVDVVVLGLQVLSGTPSPVTTFTTPPAPSSMPLLASGATISGPPLMYVQVGTVAALGASGVVWTPPVAVSTDGSATAPVKVNPGGSGRYLRVRFLSQDPGVQWRVSFFEIHCRPGGTY